LFRRGRYDMIDILMDEFRKTDSKDIEQMDWYDSVLCKEGIRRYLNDVSYGLYGEPMRGNQKEFFMMSPLYFAMITGDLKKCRKLIKNERHWYSPYIDSAIAFRDTEFLKLLLKKGERFHHEAIINNCDDPEARKYLCENFSEYLFIDGYKYDGSPMNATEFIRHSVDPWEMLRFASSYLNIAGAEHFDENFEGLQKIGAIEESDIIGCYDDLHRYDLQGLINIKSILADEVQCIARYGRNVYHLSDYFIIDLSFMKDENDFLEHFDADKVTVYINHNNLIFDPWCTGAAAVKIYAYDDEEVIGAMISKGHINEENAEGVLKYLTKKKLRHAAKALKKLLLTNHEQPV
ncbi:MAG: hypothetical protein J1F11_09955, partial [Oscillospiraceae bacterium]|nr:hypothetical protein [Oscillospiraceae bacterium]